MTTLALLLLFTCTVTAVNVTQKFYSQDVTCSKQETLWFISQSGTCTAAACSNLNGITGSSTVCPGGSVTFPAGWTYVEIWQSSTTCSGASLGIVALPADTCSGIWTSSTIKLNCATGTINDCSASVASCTGCSSKPATSGGGCVAGDPTSSLGITSYKWTCPAVTTTTTTTTNSTPTPTTTAPATTTPSSSTCFHESTIIRYKSVLYSLSQLQSLEGECRIPHIVTAAGVRIFTSCSKGVLRLTKDHLVFTRRGLVTAASLTKSDVLFRDLKETEECYVTQIEQEEQNQQYFGLNCHESQVLAGGIKTSTFGRYHVVPALWMKLLGSAFGIEKASKWGDTIVSWLF
jgi:hypothetical protein